MANVIISADRIESAKTGDQDAMWGIVTDLEPMLMSIVRTVTAGQALPEDVEDLMQEARFALITCVASFTTDGPGQLQTKAWSAVRNAVTSAWTRTAAFTVEPSTLLIVRRALARAGGDVDEAYALALAQAGSLTRATFSAAREALSPMESLDRPVDGDEPGGTTLADTIPDVETVSGAAVTRDLAEYALSSITARRALVLRATYGVGMPPMEDREIGGHLGNVGPTRVRRIRWDGIRQARTALGVAVPAAA
ncbi:hypothetical protein [Kitasatospora sp. NPDC050543]|uniref:hypothetical protein n=1 Tax=Kitasatospora sp. NPDC050543 TaxID=3364054 RepID=UPI00379DA346